MEVYVCVCVRAVRTTGALVRDARANGLSYYLTCSTSSGTKITINTDNGVGVNVDKQQCAQVCRYGITVVVTR